MNALDRVMATINRQPTDRTPIDCWLYQKQFLERLEADYGPREKFMEEFGVDVFVEYTKGSPDDLGAILSQCEAHGMNLEMIDNRGMAVWPNGMPGIFCSDSFRARFKLSDGTNGTVDHHSIIQLLERITAAGIEFLKTELLYNFNGTPGFTRGQGQ